MLLRSVYVDRYQICDICDEVSDAKQPEFNSVTFDFTRSHDSRTERHQDCEDAAECVPCNVEQYTDEEERKQDSTMRVSYVVVD